MRELREAVARRALEEAAGAGAAPGPEDVLLVCADEASLAPALLEDGHWLSHHALPHDEKRVYALNLRAAAVGTPAPSAALRAVEAALAAPAGGESSFSASAALGSSGSEAFPAPGSAALGALAAAARRAGVAHGRAAALAGTGAAQASALAACMARAEAQDRGLDALLALADAHHARAGDSAEERAPGAGERERAVEAREARRALAASVETFAEALAALRALQARALPAELAPGAAPPRAQELLALAPLLDLAGQCAAAQALFPTPREQTSNKPTNKTPATRLPAALTRSRAAQTQAQVEAELHDGPGAEPGSPAALGDRASVSLDVGSKLRLLLATMRRDVEGVVQAPPPPLPPSRTNWARLVPSSRTNRTRLVRRAACPRNTPAEPAASPRRRGGAWRRSQRRRARCARRRRGSARGRGGSTQRSRTARRARRCCRRWRARRTRRAAARRRRAAPLDPEAGPEPYSRVSGREKTRGGGRRGSTVG